MDRIPLSKDFYLDEFACKCGCGKAQPSPELVNRLQIMRDFMGRAITIVSGCRCETHNTAVGGGPEHPDGDAGDLEVEDSAEAYSMMEAAYFADFNRIGFGKKGGVLTMHVGVSLTLPNPRLWGY